MKYFNESEFSDFSKMDETLLYRLDKMREYYGKPISITSSYRSPDHPIEAAKRSPGVHSRGLAVDVAAVGGTAMLELVEAAIKAGFQRIGISRKNNFLHVDVADVTEDKVRSIWTY